MSADLDPHGPDLSRWIAARGAACGITLSAAAVDAICGHARAVLRENATLHLTSIVEPAAFLERHVGESLEGASLLEERIEGELLDLGSGNGYPALPLVAARAGLRPLLVEASSRKAAFLRGVLEQAFPRGEVIERQVQRAADLPDCPKIRVLTTRAAGGWERWVPRMVGCLAPHADVLLWAGEGVEGVSRREVWRRLTLVERRALPGRERSWIWRFRPIG